MLRKKPTPTEGLITEIVVPGWIVGCLALIAMTLVLFIGLGFFASQKPLGSVETAAPLFWKRLTQKDPSENTSPFSLQDFLSDHLAKRFPENRLQAHYTQLLGSADYAQPIEISHYKRGVSKDGDAVVYFQTPQYLVQSHWSSHSQWLKSAPWFRLRWKLNNLCIVEEAVARTSQRFVATLISSNEKAYEMTLDHAYPRRQMKWIRPVLLTQWEYDLKQQPKANALLAIDAPVRFENYFFVSQQHWKGIPVKVSFSGAGYGKQGCLLRVAKIESAL